MTSTMTALFGWLRQFGLPVYDENDVPEDAELPYITAPSKDPAWDEKATYYIEAWYYTKSNAPVADKADEIAAAIGTGVRIPCAGGLLVLWPETPLTQIIVEGNVRRAYINCLLNAYHCPGQ